MNDVESSMEGVHGSKQAFLFGCGVSDVKSLKLAVQLTVSLRCGHNQTLNQGYSRFVSWTNFVPSRLHIASSSKCLVGAGSFILDPALYRLSCV